MREELAAMQETRPSVTDTMTVTATATPEHIIPETSATPGSMTVTEPPVTETEPPGEVTTRPSPPRARGEMRQGMLTRLRAYPEGLRAEEMDPRAHLSRKLRFRRGRTRALNFTICVEQK